MADLHEFVEQLRDPNPIEDVIRENAIALRGHGWLQLRSSKRKNYDVTSRFLRLGPSKILYPLELLTGRSHIEMPKSQEVNEGEVRKHRATTDVFGAPCALVAMGTEIASGPYPISMRMARTWTRENADAARPCRDRRQ